MLKRVIAILGVVFALATFAGTAYVVGNGGRVSAGYAAAPMALALGCLAWAKQLQKKN